MSTHFKLKPFNFNLSDLNFIRDQINFRPLFDAVGNVIVAWDGTGPIYDSNNLASRTLLWDGVSNIGTTGSHTAATATAFFGTSYDTVTAAQGLRDVTGNNNNLLLVNKFWGAVDQPFMQSVAPDFAHYIKPMTAGPDAFYANSTFTLSASQQALVTAQGAAGPDYTKTSTHAGTSIVDYTPRMISRTITTGGATPLQDGNGQVIHWYEALYADASAAGLAYKTTVDTAVAAWNLTHPGAIGNHPADPNHIDLSTLIDGAAIMKDQGLLSMGGAQHDPQDPTNGELFFGAINPGVAPGNSFLAYFGQFFDHGLDFIGKGADSTKITIPLAHDDPLYRAPDPNVPGDLGNTKITVSRADVSGFDANGKALWINHTSPYIDQSQTYGSHAQMTTLLREWVSTDSGTTFHAGAHLLDGSTSVSWTNGFGEATNATLPTLAELRAHLIATGRTDLNWDDVTNLRARDASGHLIDSDGNSANGIQGVSTGQALLLDMNPHFDARHFVAVTGESGGGHYVGIDVAKLQALDPAIASVTFGGPNLVTVNYTSGASVGLPQLVNFANFSIFPVGSAPGQLTQAQYNVANEILMESVGDHYIAGDGRVNENIGLTTIHHVFHEEHNYQVKNIEAAILEQDARAVTLGDSTHSIAHDWQVNTNHGVDTHGNFLTAAGTI
jgi:Animal haem peroxidase